MMNKFDGPVPGESLTRPPRQFPWERPPEYTDKDDVAEFYLKRFSDPDRMGSCMDMLELGMPLKNLVEGIMRVGVSKGLHTIDVGLLVAPILHEYIKTTADMVGVEYEEGFENKKEKEANRKKIEALKTQYKLSKIPVSKVKESMGDM